ncbi:MAG: response regulator [Bdellovibrionales bacterium]|nr:response regulator [Bdellovibrionales bacterium]
MFTKNLSRQDVAAYLAKAKSEIFEDWEMRARQRVEAAKVQTKLALLDSLPQFMDRLVATLHSVRPEDSVQTNTDVANEHAEDRASQPEYTLDQVIAEYHLLRVTILESIEDQGLIEIETRKIYHEFVDLSISKAAIRYIEIEAQRQTQQTAEIEATRVEAERASQAKSAFLANMSHEIRTPLGAIMGFVSLIKDSKVVQDPEVSNFLSIIERNSQHLLRVIDDILDLTKVESGKMEIETVEFNLIEFLADFSSLTGMKAREKGIVFEFLSETPLPEFILSDPTRIRQILSNVVGNAIKFTERGRVELRLIYTPNHIEFKITDTGRGITEEQRKLLFKAFSQADSSTTRKFGGTGLGLILSKKLSQALGGDFTLTHSKIGCGSEFKVEFPVSVPVAAQLVPLQTAKVSPPPILTEPIYPNLQDFEVLLVEDSPDNQYLIQKMLEKTGAKIALANNGAEGVDMALAKDFGVVLMDIQMPIMDGHQAVRALRSRGFKVPVVALTAHAMKDEGERATQSGFSHFLTKPIHRKNLTDLLESIHRQANLET